MGLRTDLEVYLGLYQKRYENLSVMTNLPLSFRLQCEKLSHSKDWLVISETCIITPFVLGGKASIDLCVGLY